MTTDVTTLEYQTLKKMINKLLTEERVIKSRTLNSSRTIKPFTKEELAQRLGITVKDITKVLSSITNHHGIVTQVVSNALTKLYCATKWKT